MYRNEYNTQIAQRLLENNDKLIRHQGDINAMADTPFTCHIEGMALRDQNVIGGSGYAEATVRGVGYAADKTEGATGSGNLSPWLRLANHVGARRGCRGWRCYSGIGGG